MSIFNDKALKGVAAAVAKIMDEELKGNQHKIDANKNGKVDAHDFKLLRGKKTIKEDDVGYQHRYSVKNGKATVHNPAKGEKDEPHHIYADSAELAVSKHAARTKAPMKESLDEAFPTVDDAKKRMDAGKTSSGTVTKTKTGLVHKRDHDKDDAASDTQKKSTKYGARQSFERSSRVNEKPGKYKKVEKRPDDRSKIDTKSYKVSDRAAKALDSMRGSLKEERLSFTEMLELYNEHGVEVINKIFPQTVKFGDTEVELIDANEVNGVVGITVEEGVMSAVKGAVGVVKDVISKERAYQAQKQMSTGNTLKKLRKEESLSEEPDNETFTKEVEAQKEKNAGRGKKAEVAKPSVQAVKQEEVEQIDELSKDTLSMYVKKAHYSGGMADFKHGRIADKRGDSKDKMKLSKISRNRERGINKAVDRLTKKD